MPNYSFHLPYSVRIADINYGGHVSNAAVLNYFQDARIAYLAHLGPYSERDIGDGCGIIVSESRVRYRAEMFLGDALQIAVAIGDLQRSAMTMCFRVERSGRVTAEGETQLVAFDYAKRRPRRIPESFRSAVLRQEEHLAGGGE